MRHFRHLTRAEILDIVVSHSRGETQTALALRFNIDRSTVHYHLKKYDGSYLEDGSIYAAIKSDIRKTCIHPSARCTLCTEMWDELRRTERDEIRQLKASLEDARSRLRIAGFAVE